MKFNTTALTTMLFLSALTFSSCKDKDKERENRQQENQQKNKNSSNEKHNNSSGQENQYNIQIDENGSIIDSGNLIRDIAISELTEVERTAILYVREEEKLARDVYLAFDTRYSSEVSIFGNIAKAEQTHTDTVKILIERYNLTDPMSVDEDENLGVFKNEKLQTVYNNLIEKGNTSLIDAIEVGLTIEDLDIYDIEKEIEHIDNEDILVVFKSLVKGSENHMKAFFKQYEGTYTPQYIDQNRYNEIVN